MSNVQSFIENLSFPTSLENLDGIIKTKEKYDVEAVLAREQYIWTAPRWGKIGDIVFFMHAKTALNKIKHLMRDLNNNQENFSEAEYKKFAEWLERAKEIYEKYGGKIFALGSITGQPEFYEDDELEVDVYIKSKIYAEIEIMWLLQNPIELSEFREFIRLQQGAITPVFGDSFDKLKELIISKNPDVPEYFLKAEAVLMPFAKINQDNWLNVANLYRREFFLEIQFRKFYVDYFLSVLGDNKTFYSECHCKRAGNKDSIDSIVDNIILMNKKYLPVEVKLNISNERDLNAQLQKYCNNDTIYLKQYSNKLLPNEKIFSNNVLVFDTEKIYLYDNHNDSLTCLVNLDEIKTEKDIKEFRKNLIKKFLS